MTFYRRWRLAIVAGLSLFAAASQLAGAEPEPTADDLSQYDAIVQPSDRDHWAFRPVRRPEIPTVERSEWVRNPIDAFILAELESAGWLPAAQAEPRALLRRLYLDLIGLPPTPAEQEAFLADPSPDAWQRVVDRLLARPAHGERWARHWLDLARYAESNGFERDAAKPHVWRYRDWVIRSFNEDKPYDQFVLEQLAGDEIPQANADSLVALGFTRLGPWDDEPADPAEDRFDQMDDIASTTSQVFLGLTLGCARCHNHKFEPFSMLDYYRMIAVFNPLQRPQEGRTELDLPAGTQEEHAAIAERDRQLAELSAQAERIRGAFRAEFLEVGGSQLPAAALAALQTSPDRRDETQRDLAGQFEAQFQAELAAALPPEQAAQLAEIDRQQQRLRQDRPDLPRAYFMTEPPGPPPVTHVLLRGKAAQPGPQAPPGVPAVLAIQQPEFPQSPGATSQRRLTLARWIASADNPLTARVMVNRVWQYHFGEGLVRTPSDFGVMGAAPTHPQLLDWLADWFVEQGWSLKALHRLIVTSNAYRMSKAGHAEYGLKDPENLRLWRSPYRRLEVEAIRDSMLSAAGTLNEAMYGPSVYPYVPAAALAGHSDPDKIWPPFDERASARRTVYVFVKRSLIVPMIEVLDFCDTTRTAPQRVVTSVAPQALALFNGDFVNRQAAHLAARLAQEAGPDLPAQIDLAYRLTLCRPASAAEQESLARFIAAETEQVLADASGDESPLSRDAARERARVQACRVILNLNEFVYPD